MACAMDVERKEVDFAAGVVEIVGESDSAELWADPKESSAFIYPACPAVSSGLQTACLYKKLRPGCYFKYITDGLENVQQKKIFKENKKRTQQRKEPCPADSVESLMAEMPFVDTDIEDEFVMHATSEINIKKKRKRTTGREIEEGSERKKKKNKQYQPNYFISLPITNPEITGSIQAVQDAIIQKDQRLSKAMVRSGSLHVTMFVMHLSNEEEISIAVGALSDSKDFVEDLLKGKTVDLSFQGIDHFRNEVGFVKLAENDQTTILTEIA
ncbi:PREDICTED: A-kinase anchor protein 7 isoform gamma-like, partial [Leptosomus discolor]|uniref:A-kinase anchor protein 7 isoform gamma-like n=1 Tax=Leptosomus discolor TaxID=188344 RepID=UPI00052252D5